eukprot:COSAG01_NODE_6244_length_3770_cov_36.061530_5_plen_62_part_00
MRLGDAGSSARMVLSVERGVWLSVEITPLTCGSVAALRLTTAQLDSAARVCSHRILLGRRG